MDLQKTANWAQILGFFPAIYCAWAVWVSRQEAPAAPASGWWDKVAAMSTSSPGWFVAFGAFVALMSLGVVLQVLNGRGKRTGSKARSQGSVTVFTHDSALVNNPAVSNQIESEFKSGGWKVSLGRTNLPQHANGIWVRGNDGPERTSLVWGLKVVLGLEPKVEDADDGTLQIIVGTILKEVKTEANRPIARRPDGEIGQVDIPEPPRPEPLPDALSDRDVVLKWHPTTHGVNFLMHNGTPEMIERCGVDVLEILKWSASARKFIVVPQFHPDGKTFTPIRLTGPKQVFPERDAEFSFIRFDGDGQMIAGANTKTSSAIQHKTTEPGTWLVRLQVKAMGRQRQQEAFFVVERGLRPEPTVDPRLS